MNKLRWSPKGLLEELIHRETTEMPVWLVGLVRVGRFLFMTASEFNKDQGFTRAAGMAYTSLLALVPALAIVLAAFAIFDRSREMLDQLQVFLINNLVPALSGAIQGHINSFINNVNKVGVVGTLALLVVTILLFNSIEQSFNHVFNVRRKRTFVRKFMAFTSVIVWGPAMIGFSIWLTGRLGELFQFEMMTESALLSRLVYFITPLLLSMLAFVAVFLMIPAARVKVRSALLGAVISAILWEAAKVAFAVYVPKAVNYSTIYGSLAVIPLFLIWLYYTWLITLLGLEAVYVHQNYEGLLASRRHADILRGRQRLHMALRLFIEIAGPYRKGKGPVALDHLVKQFKVPYELVRELLDEFLRRGLLIEAACDQEAYVPGKSLDTLPVVEVVSAVYKDDSAWKSKSADPDILKVDELLERMEQAAIGSMDGLTIEQVFTLTK